MFNNIPKLLLIKHEFLRSTHMIVNEKIHLDTTIHGEECWTRCEPFQNAARSWYFCYTDQNMEFYDECSGFQVLGKDKIMKT